MERYKKASFYCVIAFLVISVSATFLELPFIQAQQGFYLGGKIFFHVWLVVLCFQVHKDAFKLSTNLQVGTMMIAYCIHGQYFSPWYMFVFHELIIAFALLFPLPKKIFTAFAIVATGLYTAMMLWRFDNIHHWLNENSRIDWVISAVAIAVVAVLLNSFFTSDRNLREETVRKFGLVGLQTATVIHDVKSMISTPYMSIGILKTKLANHSDPEVKELIQDVQSQLDGIISAMTGLNQIVALQKQSKETFTVSSVVEEVTSTLNLTGRKIHLNLQCDYEIHTEKALFKSIIFNILMNSIQSFRARQVKDPKITVFCTASEGAHLNVEIADNAGGYRPELLSLLATDESQREHGTGMGLFLISTGMQSIGGRVSFSNTDKGALVTLSFLKNPSGRGARKTLV